MKVKTKKKQLTPYNPQSGIIYDIDGYILVKLPDDDLYHIFTSDFSKCGWPGICDCEAHSPTTLCNLPREPFVRFLMGDYNPKSEEVCERCLNMRNKLVNQ